MKRNQYLRDCLLGDPESLELALQAIANTPASYLPHSGTELAMKYIRAAVDYSRGVTVSATRVAELFEHIPAVAMPAKLGDFIRAVL